MNFRPKPDGAAAPADSHVFEAGEANFETDVLQASLQTPVLVDFWATWCGPCKTLGPILEKLAGEYAGAFRLAKVDCDKEQQLAGMFGVRGDDVEGAVGADIVRLIDVERHRPARIALSGNQRRLAKVFL